MKSELGDLCVILILDVRDGDTPPPVFWKKRLQGIENKGQGREKERQESSRGGKRLEGKEIEEATFLKEFGRGPLLRRWEGEGRVWRVFTTNGTTY